MKSEVDEVTELHPFKWHISFNCLDGLCARNGLKTVPILDKLEMFDVGWDSLGLGVEFDTMSFLVGIWDVEFKNCISAMQCYATD